MTPWVRYFGNIVLGCRGFGSAAPISTRPAHYRQVRGVIFCRGRLFRVTGGKTPTEYMFSELPQIADIGSTGSPQLPETARYRWD
jgi:hypothetical protein